MINLSVKGTHQRQISKLTDLETAGRTAYRDSYWGRILISCFLDADGTDSVITSPTPICIVFLASRLSRFVARKLILFTTLWAMSG